MAPVQRVSGGSQRADVGGVGIEVVEQEAKSLGQPPQEGHAMAVVDGPQVSFQFLKHEVPDAV